ncbi:MAG: FtsX-like permease family protein, partial [Opitutaceae bacterium]
WWTLQILWPLVLAGLPAPLQSQARVGQFLSLGVDFRVVAFTGLLAGVATIAAGLMPALQVSRADLVSVGKNEGSAFGRRLTDSRLRNLLIVSQVAVSLSLLSGAGLLLRNTIKLRGFDLGYDPNVLFAVHERPATAPDVSRRAAAETLRAMPAVAAVSQLFGPVVGTGGFMTPVKGGGAASPANFVFVSPEFFGMVGLSPLRGRTFHWPEIDGEARTLVISEGLARRLWPGEDAVGRTLAVGEEAFAFPQRTEKSEYRDYVVIGIVRDIRVGIWDTTPGFVFLPLTAQFGARSEIFIRPRGDSAVALGEIARAAEAEGRTLRFDRILADAFDLQKLPFRGLAALSGALGGLALAMAAVGLYGVMAFSVAQRSREIGIRKALGATAEKVVRHFVQQGMRLVAVGMVVGLGGGALFALLLRKLMFGLGGAFDLIAFVGVTALLGGIALVACWLPARRAAKVDPMVALRAE